jgi:membrane protein DedA with SNARE-associated domain
MVLSGDIAQRKHFIRLMADEEARMEVVQEFVLSTIASPVIYLLLFALVVIDGFFPPVPSETVVVASAAIGAATGSPNPLIIGAIAAVAAAIGDTIAFLVGQSIGTDRFAWMRRPRVVRTLDWARRGLDRRAVFLILTARYVPVGRIAVNMTAGATRFPLRRFIPLAVLAGACWSAYSIGIGLLAGSWAHEHPLIGAGVGIVIAISLGFVVEVTSSLVSRRRMRRSRSATIEQVVDQA